MRRRLSRQLNGYVTRIVKNFNSREQVKQKDGGGAWIIRWAVKEVTATLDAELARTLYEELQRLHKLSDGGKHRIQAIENTSVSSLLSVWVEDFLGCNYPDLLFTEQDRIDRFGTTAHG